MDSVIPAPEQKPKSSRKLFLRIFCGIVIFAIVAVVALFIDYQAIYDWGLTLSYEPSTEMEQTINNIELTSRGERIVKASFAEFQDAKEFNANCPNTAAETSVLGCYYDWRIYVYDVDNVELDGIKEAVLAHELLHADWQRERQWIKKELEPFLRQAYEDNKDALAEHMENYSDDSFIDELHSVIGTQVDTAKLPSRLQNHYRSLFRNHAKIVSYFNRYNDKFVELKQEMEDLAAKIDKNRQEIEKLTKEYRQKAETLAKDIDTFNQRASSGYYTNQWQFDTDRASLVQRQKELDEEYQKLSAEINKTNALITQYNQNVARSGELYRSIDSKIDKVDSLQK